MFRRAETDKGNERTQREQSFQRNQGKEEIAERSSYDRRIIKRADRE